MENVFNLSDKVVSLLREEPFFASFSRRIQKRPSRDIPTAGVRVDKATQQFEMLYNPDFFAALSDEFIVGVLKHEFYHIILGHVTLRKPESGLKKIDNIAMDLAINSYLARELPTEKNPGPPINGSPMKACIPGEGPFKDLPSHMSYEWYLEALKDMSEQQGAGEPEDGEGNFGGMDSLDNHDDFGDGSSPGDPSDAIAKERLKQHIKNAVQEAASKPNGWGTIPADMRELIKKSYSSTIDWRAVLRYFVKTSERSDRRSTPRRINRRFPKIHPGKRIRRHAKIAISIDQSGSVDDNMLSLFFAELNKLSELASFTIIPFDTRVNEDLIYVWKKGETRDWERVMCGGTDFNPPTKYVNEKKFDGHIILTDLMAPKPIASTCQRMWMTTEEYANQPYFTTSEKIIAIKK
tara:strand:- start:325 stop:1548 length:1224 start_codon:yes stop_codon:yes gene_type:complete